MNHIPRVLLLGTAAVLAAACASLEERQQGMRETDRTRANERRVCLMQPPAQIEACLRRVEEDFIARENMGKLEPRTEAAPPPPPSSPPATE